MKFGLAKAPTAVICWACAPRGVSEVNGESQCFLGVYPEACFASFSVSSPPGGYHLPKNIFTFYYKTIKICVCMGLEGSVHSSAETCRGQKKAADSLCLELQQIVSCPQGIGNPTWVSCKSSNHPSLLSRLSSP